MLIEFRVENHRSILDEQVLSMEAARSGEDDDPRPRSIAGHSSKLLPVAAIYGANASGKSNLLSAFGFMVEAVGDSHRLWAPDEGVPRDPFAWGPKRDEPSLFEVEMVIGGTRFQYGFLVDDLAVLEEWVHAWPNGKKQIWLEREGDSFKFGEHLKGENKVIEGATRPNALYLSAAAQFRHAQLSRLFHWFRSVLVPGGSSSGFPSSRCRVETARAALGARFQGDPRPQSADLGGVDASLEQLGLLLRSADVGILEIRRKPTGTNDGSTASRRSGFELKHESEAGDAWLPLEEESQGTRTLFNLALPVLKALREGSVLVVDELESSMHPALADLIVRQFNDPKINTRNAQLIFATHDTNLLGTLNGEPALRRDQVWFTEKDQKGGTVLYPLTNYKPRKDENLERGYLQGRYGAIPFLGDFRLTGREAE